MIEAVGAVVGVLSGVIVGVAVSVSVAVGVTVGVAVTVRVDVSVAVGVDVAVAVGVSVAVSVGVDVTVAVCVVVGERQPRQRTAPPRSGAAPPRPVRVATRVAYEHGDGLELQLSVRANQRRVLVAPNFAVRKVVVLHPLAVPLVPCGRRDAPQPVRSDYRETVECRT